jgi:hypothetical protein
MFTRLWRCCGQIAFELRKLCGPFIGAIAFDFVIYALALWMFFAVLSQSDTDVYVVSILSAIFDVRGWCDVDWTRAQQPPYGRHVGGDCIENE